MGDSLEKFQSLLRELFQFDCTDLDFGIYRIMNYKRAVIERFIAEDLPRWVNDELNKGVLAAQAQAAQDLEDARQKVLEALGEDALDAEGNLTEENCETKAGKEYLAAQERAQSAKGHETLETSIYNHLYTFFSRYWQDGDFISKRRYSKKERYAIPYNGEEVYLYWANHDQYYVKTGEYFTDYTWKAPNGVTVHFKLKTADVEQNNVKGEKRFFLPVLSEIAWDAEALTIPFEFRPLTQQEQIAYGQKNQQEAIISKTLADIHKRLPKVAPEALAALTVEKRRTDKGETVTHLEHHLRQYTRRNTSDFFIHKDLHGFLSRELDFYLKNEVLNLEEMEAAGEGLAEGWFQLLRLVKSIGLRIIEFLAQIEDFQKMLWEKKKFVTETFYVITVGNIPEAFYTEIAANEAQWEEWKSLLHIDEEQDNLFTAGKGKMEKGVEFLKAHPALPLDTRHFPMDFVDRLLATYDNLDDLTDGLLVHSENWQALNLLQEKYRERVRCIYIDPPYNTGNDSFVYKDTYEHSSWLGMMRSRLQLAKATLTEESAVFISIDDNERERLHIMADLVLGRASYLNTFVWVNNLKGRQISDRGAAGTHEYVLAYGGASVGAFKTSASWAKETMPSVYKGFSYDVREDEHGPYVVKNELYNTNSKFNEETSPSLVFNIHYNFTTGAVTFSDTDDPREFEGFVKITPHTNSDNVHRYHAWRWSQEKIASETHDLLFEKAGTSARIYTKVRDFQSTMLKDLIGDIPTNAGTSLLLDLFETMPKAEYPKPIRLIEIFAMQVASTGRVLDYFAGSGTTGHAVINLNREDGGRRKFILVEMADYFDTVLLPRLKKVTFSPEWKDGRPKRVATQEEFERGPRIVKVIRLESYEDALNNLSFDESSGQMAMQFEDYLLKYMLKWETRHSETLLNVEQLNKPFDYCLHIHRDGETRVQKVDLPETFAYLIGLDVTARRVLENDGRCYLVYRGTTREGQRAVVIWRETEGWTEKDYKRDRDFVAAQKLTESADLIYVNGDSLITSARALEGMFKARMFAGVEG